MKNILSIIVGFISFISTVLAFGLGVKYGMAIKNGSPPKIEPLKPIQEIKERKEMKEKSAEMDNAFKNLMGYKGETN